jgi:predicted transcriptional regulator of viral defense system
MKIDQDEISSTQNIAGLSQREAIFLALLAEEERTIFRFSDALEYWRDAPAARSALSRLQRGGWLKRIERGLYMVIPLDAGPGRMWSENSLVIASYLTQHGAVAYWSALHYWNMTEQLPRTVFVQSPQRKSKAELTVAGVRYQFITVLPQRFFGLVRQPINNHILQLTDREKTLIDAADRTDLAGGIRQLARALQEHWQELDWWRLDGYLVQFGSGAVLKRLGYMIDLLTLPIPDRDQRLERWREHLTTGIVLLEPGSERTGPISRRWRIRDNVNLVAPNEESTV